MYDTLIVSALETACLSDSDLSCVLGDHLRRMTGIDAERPLDLTCASCSHLPTDPFNPIHKRNQSS